KSSTWSSAVVDWLRSAPVHGLLGSRLLRGGAENSRSSERTLGQVANDPVYRKRARCTKLRRGHHAASLEAEAENALERLAKHPARGPRVTMPDHTARCKRRHHVGGLLVGLAAIDLDLSRSHMRNRRDLQPQPVGGF